MRCLACDAILIPDPILRKDEIQVLVNGEPNYDHPQFDDWYQFDNALWIGFFGGYGMFTDEMAGWPTNGMTRFTEDGEEDPDWKPEYAEKRTLPGRPDHEAVICHECAHELCDKIPWIHKLIDPHRSHAHRSRYHEEHPDHYGWDYDRKD